MKKFLIFAILLGIVIFLMNGTIERTPSSGDALFDALGDSIIDTVTISNDIYETPYVCMGYHSYGQTLSNDTAPIITISIKPCFASITDSVETGPWAVLYADTITKNANVDATTWHSLSDYYPANQKFIVKAVCSEIDVTDTDSIGTRMYYAMPSKK